MFEARVLYETPGGIERGSALDGESAEATTGLVRYEPGLGGWTFPSDGPPHDADAERSFVPRSRTVLVSFEPSAEALGDDATLLSPVTFLESIGHFVCHYRDEVHLQDGRRFEYVQYVPEHRACGGTVR